MLMVIQEYCVDIEAAVALSPVIRNILEYKTRITECGGYVRMKLALVNDDVTELFEYFSIDEAMCNIVTEKYSYHWQSPAGEIRKRWDNAPHHREIETYPHHLHDGSEDNVKPSQVIGMVEIVTLLNELVLS
ncbi:MAG: DUF6516 family protein [Bacillota bacterium]